MYKCFTIKLTKKQVTGMLDHADSPYVRYPFRAPALLTLSCLTLVFSTTARYIRAIGFLYLRMCTNPKLLWDWFEPYLADEEEITIRYKGKPTYVDSWSHLGTFFTHVVVDELLQNDWFSCGGSAHHDQVRGRHHAALPRARGQGDQRPLGRVAPKEPRRRSKAHRHRQRRQPKGQRTAKPRRRLQLQQPFEQ